MGVPWNYGPVQFEAEADTPLVVELKVPHRGKIRQLLLDEIGGADAASFEVFNSEDAAHVFSGSSESSALEGGQHPKGFSLFGAKTLAAGQFADYDMEVMYSNQDGTPTNPVRRLWMVFTHTGAGVNTYQMSMVIEMPDLSS